MGEPKNVLLVTNSTTEGEIALIKEAIIQAEQQQKLQIKLSLVHVIPNLPTCYFNIPSMVLLAERYYDEATQCLTEVGTILGTHKKDQWIITGRVKTEVLRLANRLHTHFILASSTSIQDLHESFLFSKRGQNTTPIRTIGSLVNL